MSVTNIIHRSVVTAVGHETVRAAAWRMAESDVGTVVVVDEDDGTPAGIVTDRDITVRCLGRGLDPDQARLSEIMSRPVHLVYEHVPLDQALARMAAVGTRRLVVTGERNRIAGILCLDDALQTLAGEVESIGRIVAAQGAGNGRQMVVAGAGHS